MDEELTELGLFGVDKFISIIVITIIILLGLSEIIHLIKRNGRHRDYIFRFREKVVSWFNTNCDDQAAYNEIIYESPKAQKYLSGWGVTDFQPPFKNYIQKNWPIILNAIPMINQSSRDHIFRDQAAGYMRLVDESLLRGLADLDDKLESYRSELKNPFRWLFRGGNIVVSLPIILFLEFGLISKKLSMMIRDSLLFKLFVFSSMIVGLIAAVLTIVIGWEKFYSILMKFIE